MKVTKSRLTQIIKEEFEKVKGAEAKKKAYLRAKEMTASGITDGERAVIEAVEEKLMAAAQEGRIDTGKVVRYLEQYVFPALDKIIGEPEVDAEAEIEPEL